MVSKLMQHLDASIGRLVVVEAYRMRSWSVTEAGLAKFAKLAFQSIGSAAAQPARLRCPTLSHSFIGLAATMKILRLRPRRNGRSTSHSENNMDWFCPLEPGSYSSTARTERTHDAQELDAAWHHIRERTRAKTSPISSEIRARLGPAQRIHAQVSRQKKNHDFGCGEVPRSWIFWGGECWNVTGGRPGVVDERELARQHENEVKQCACVRTEPNDEWNLPTYYGNSTVLHGSGIKVSHWWAHKFRRSWSDMSVVLQKDLAGRGGLLILPL